MKSKLGMFFIVLLTVSLLFTIFIRIQNSSSRVVIITTDDVSPKFNLEKYEKLFAILDNHSIPATLFLVPNFDGKYPIESSTDFINLIKQKQTEGYEIAQEGYEHTKNEFGLLNYSEAEDKLTIGRIAIEQTFQTNICGFRPPYWAENFEVKKALKDLGYCYDADAFAIKFEHGWHTNVWITEFLKTEGEFIFTSAIHKPFIIVLHANALTPAGYKYLEEFLDFAEKQDAVFKTYKDVYGTRSSTRS